MGNEECLRCFGRHCRSFYDSSLILYPSSSSLSSMKEEKKSEEYPDGYDTKSKGVDGKVVVEALDRIGAIRSIVMSMHHQQESQKQSVVEALEKSIENLRQEHASVADGHHDLLSECGLLDITLFTDPSSADEATRLLEQYTRVRDAMRRRAHKISMLHRQNSLYGLLSESSTTDDERSASTVPRLTQVKHVQNTLSIIQKFVSKYESNIGSHSFLAGLHRIVNLQLNPTSRNKHSSSNPAYIVRWKFRGSVLTEACRSCHGKNNENENDELAYAREAIGILFSFLTSIKDIDVEEGEFLVPVEETDLRLDEILNSSHAGEASTADERSEPFLSFEVDKHLSNANLRHILAVLPNPKRLDARATGTVETIECSSASDGGNASNLVARKNVDGHEDEKWPWFARWQSCTVL